MKKKLENKNSTNQLEIDFNKKSSGEVRDYYCSVAKVITLDYRAHIYRSILNRKMK